MDKKAPLRQGETQVEAPETEEAQKVATNGARGSARRIMGEVVNEEATKERIRKLIDNALQLKGSQRAHCPNCRKIVMAEVPDVKGRIDAIVKILEQAEGKPMDAEAGGVTIVVERPAR